MKKFVVYQTVNPFNGHYYIGKATSSRVERGYKGSGQRLKEAFAKYGKENFKTTILWDFDTEVEAFAKEREIVTTDLILDPRCYNMQEGGSGGTKGSKFLTNGERIVRVLPEQVQEYLDAGYIPWRRPHSKETREKMSKSHKGKPGTMKGRHHSEETRKKISEAGKGRVHSEEWKQKVSAALKGHEGYWKGKESPNKGRIMSEESRRKMSEAHKGKPAWNRGMTGSGAGTVWMNKDGVNKRIKPDQLQRFENDGWFVGKIRRLH